MVILVLAGGLSPERDVSLVSGGLIANALAARGHRVLLADIYEGINLEGCKRPYSELFTERPDYKFRVSQEPPDLDLIRRMNYDRRELIGEGIMELCRAADLVFIALHGDMGENGQLQATFDNYDIKYTGSGYIGSLLAMDKDISKRILKQSGIPTPPWVYFDTGGDEEKRIIDEVGLPCVVKPCSCGSSVGITIVSEAGQLSAALKAAAAHERRLVVEKKIEGREFSVGIIDGAPLPAIEIIPKSGFYDYKNKYQSGLTEEICPARLSDAEAAKLAGRSLAAFHALRLYGYARVDFILDGAGEFWCLEANTLPGMTPTSLLPQEAAAAGIDYPSLCEIIALQALGREG